MSALRDAAEEYIALRQALGHQLADAVRLLPRFVDYLERAGAEVVTVELALAWAQQPAAAPGSTVHQRRMTVARGFARHLAGIDPRTEVPAVGLIPYRQRWRPPFIYTDADIAALIAEAGRGIPTPLKAATFATLIGLLAATGLRVGEALRLDRGDVDWSEGVLLIRESKFRKSRQVPLHASALEALADYAHRRDRLQPHPEADSFFVSTRGTRLIYQIAQEGFRKLRDEAGVGATSTVRPRLHDLRHTFAVRALLGWYRAGVDVPARMPWLSTYLGHHDPRSTYWYLSAAPELLAQAASLLEEASGVNRR